VPEAFDWAHCLVVDVTQIESGLSDADPKVRARAVSSVCPCRMERQVFERFLPDVRRLQKDPDARVRAAAAHVLGESLQMQSEGQPTTRQMVTNEMARTRSRHRWQRHSPQR
jgi:HEAT repeat protein